ncbi:MAG: urease accessory protein UreF, partial [Hyphomicrobiales bacterium]
MDEIVAAMAMLQHGDSFFPSGATSFSWGIESLVADGCLTGPADARAFISGQLHARWAGFDLPAIIAAHRAAGDLDEIERIDALVEIQSSIAELRSASRRLGDAMLSVFERLGQDQARSYRSRVKKGRAHGHLPVVQGFVWANAGHDEQATIALSAHAFAVSLLGACIRLGCLGHLDAQRILTALRDEIGEIASRPCLAPDRLSSCAFEAEIA